MFAFPTFHRAMLRRARSRGYATVSHPSVCLSVRLSIYDFQLVPTSMTLDDLERPIHTLAETMRFMEPARKK